MRTFIVTLMISSLVLSCESFSRGDIPSSHAIAHKETKHTIKIAVIDTGFDFESDWSEELKAHPDLHVPEMCKRGHEDFTHTGLQDNHGHGTHIAGLISKYADGQDYCLIILKFFDPGKTAKEGTDLALEKAIDLKVDVINYSAGGTDRSEKECTLIKKALDQGITVVAAAGNEKSNINIKPYYPAMCDKRVKAVSNVDAKGTEIRSSNFTDMKKNSRFLFKEQGTDVLSLTLANSTGYMTGTSQAAAIRTGKIVHNMKK